MKPSGCPLGKRLARRADSQSQGAPRVRTRFGPSSGQRTSSLGRSCRQASVPSVPETRRRRSFSRPVLIYLLMAEHAIEIVADRGIDARVSAEHWAAMAGRMGTAFREGRFEDGLTQALEEVSALLVKHFPLAEGEPDRNELPDAPVVL